jgi:hypothetical protein
MSSFEAWDKQNSITWLIPQALTVSQSPYLILKEHIKSSCDRHPVGTMVFLEMLLISFLFMEKWFSKTSTLYLRTLLKTYKDPPFLCQTEVINVGAHQNSH